MTLELNDWTVWEGRKFWCVETYTPKQTGRRKWTYSVKLYGAASLIKQALMLNTEDSPIFSYTATAREHVALVVKNLNRWMGGITDWKVGKVEATGNIVVDYSEGLYGNDALKKIAEEAGTEWWIEGMTVNVCRCERGDEVTLGYGKGLLSIERDSADNVKFFTRLFPIGSSRNIDAEKYGSSRLLLPSRATYVERNTELGIVEHFEQGAFQEIYPRRTGKVSSVRKETKKGDDGKPFDIYYFTDGEMNFDPNEYEIGGLVKRVTFQTGQLADLGNDEDGEHYFEVNYNSERREFELITIWPYDDDTQVPGGVLEPKAEDTYILWNVRMPDEYYPIAEEEYATAVEKYMDEHCLDRSVYKCSTDYVALKKRGVVPCMGQRVRLESDRFFASGYRESHITVVDQKLERPTEADIEISDVLSQTTQSRMADEIENVRSEVKANTVELPDVIRSWDTTLPTDNNLFSARRSEQEFLSRKRNDRTKGRITFEQGVVFGEEENGFVDGKGNAELLTAVVKELLSSGDYSGGGLTDSGWKLGMDEDRLSHLIVDKLTVRQVMNVFELLINRVRSVGGQICVSAANGKIKAVEEQGDYYLISFEQENMFVRHDLVRCQTFTGTDLRSYWVEVADVTEAGIVVAKEEFEDVEPKAGDECVLMGNTEVENRQNLVLISATEDGEPRVDVMDGVSGKSFGNALRARLGNLDGIKDDTFPWNNQPRGNGLYADNVYLRGTFLLSTGEDVKTKLEITEGKVQSAIDSVRNDFLSEKGYLNNPTFASGLEKWNSENETVFFLVGNRWIWANGAALSKKGDGASVVTDMGRKVVRIRNKYIRQKHENLRFVPTFPTNGEGKKEALPVYLSFFYRCAKSGTLKIGFENVDKTGFTDFNSMEVSEEIAATGGYVQYTCSGLWNGTGDFKLAFDGDIYLYMLVLSTDKIEALTYKYKTLFEQSERLVKISAAVYDKDERALQETGLMIQPEGTGIYIKDANGKLALIGVGVEETDAEGNKKTVIKLTADNIKLEGLVTANGYFKVKEDGSIETVNGTFRGHVYAEGGAIGGFSIGHGHIGGADVIYNEDGTIEVKDTENGLFLYDDMIGFNDKDRQAIIGTWNSLGQPMLCRLVDTATDYNFDFGISPKYGIVFDIENSMNGNFAFAGKGSGVLNGAMDGYAYKKIALDQANTVFVGYMDLQAANRFIVKATQGSTVVALPKIGQVRDGLAIGKNTPFCMRITIIADIGSSNYKVCGRYSQQDSKKEYPWNTEELPVMVHWDGGHYETLDMGKGDTLEVLLVYDPDSTETLNGWPTKYTARIINKQS
ncbi:hypothetical protein [uncultured Prevotella sp.]|uniref:hypothetical protein n=1 Tax=uncultured Prevotella sp. TaxID=159272 RepID=UPI002666AABC|nr:hypothetical protein [uncultured Prevotella sp.]